MATVYSVTQINQYIKRAFTNDYLLKNVQIVGEVSNVKRDGKGNLYFTMKDTGAALMAVMFFRDVRTGLTFPLENGQRIVVSGYVSFFERDGRCQMYAKSIRLDGRGDLYEAYEQLKQRLYEEGLFEFEHKKPIPKYPKKIGIVTAKTGAAIQDIRNIAKRRNPFVQLVLYPAKVQGEGASATIVKGIQTLDQMGFDTIIIGRGGGSIEDLWAFNEECVARAIYDAKTPIISGTGHEIDNTIADYAADLRAPTPSAACELAVPDVMTLLRNLEDIEAGMRYSMANRMHKVKQRLHMLQLALDHVSPQTRYENQVGKLERLQERLQQAVAGKYQMREHQYQMYLAKLDGLSPTAKLTGGYGYIASKDNVPIKSVTDVHEQDPFSVTLWDGRIDGVVTGIWKKMENDNGKEEGRISD